MVNCKRLPGKSHGKSHGLHRWTPWTRTTKRLCIISARLGVATCWSSCCRIQGARNLPLGAISIYIIIYIYTNIYYIYIYTIYTYIYIHIYIIYYYILLYYIILYDVHHTSNHIYVPIMETTHRFILMNSGDILINRKDHHLMVLIHRLWCYYGLIVGWFLIIWVYHMSGIC